MAKNKPPWGKRVARRRRRKALAAHHKLCMKIAAAAKLTGATPSYPKRPPKPRPRPAGVRRIDPAGFWVPGWTCATWRARGRKRNKRSPGRGGERRE